MGETIEPITNRRETLDTISQHTNCEDVQSIINNCAQLHNIPRSELYVCYDRQADGKLTLVANRGAETPEEYRKRVVEIEESHVEGFVRLMLRLETLRPHIQELTQLIQKYSCMLLFVDKERLTAYLKLLRD